MISGSEAAKIARKWTEAQNYKIPHQVRPGPYREGSGGRLVHVMHEVAATRQSFLLAKLFISDAGEVTVKLDRRERVMAEFARMGVEVRPARNKTPHATLVERFIEALTSAQDLPEWYLGCSILEKQDKNKADVVIFIRYARSTRELPVKIVPTRSAKADFFRDMSSQEVARMHAVIVTVDMSYITITCSLVGRIQLLFQNGSMKFLRLSACQ